MFPQNKHTHTHSELHQAHHTYHAHPDCHVYVVTVVDSAVATAGVVQVRCSITAHPLLHNMMLAGWLVSSMLLLPHSLRQPSLFPTDPPEMYCREGADLSHVMATGLSSMNLLAVSGFIIVVRVVVVVV